MIFRVLTFADLLAEERAAQEGNPCHVPAGSPEGGQFCAGTGPDSVAYRQHVATLKAQGPRGASDNEALRRQGFVRHTLDRPMGDVAAGTVFHSLPKEHPDNPYARERYRRRAERARRRRR